VLKQLQRLPFAPVVALMFAAVAVILVLAMPVWMLEQQVVRLGVSDVLPAAAPPLGEKARLLSALLAGGAMGVVAFVAALPFSGGRPRAPKVVDVQPLSRVEAAPVEDAGVEAEIVAHDPIIEEEPQLPSFLAPPSVIIDAEPVESDDEILVLSDMVIEQDGAMDDMVAPPVAAEILREGEEDVQVEMPPVEAAPLVAPRPQVVEPRVPTIVELVDRFSRGLEEYQRSGASPIDDELFRDTLSKLEKLAAGGR
jgi:hypothetical protein